MPNIYGGITMKLKVILIIVLMLFMFVGCQQYDDVEKTNDNYPPINPFPEEDNIEVIFYYPNKDFSILVPETRLITKGNEDLEFIVSQELVKGPLDKNLSNPFSSNGKIISVDVIDEIAYVNINLNLLDNVSTENEEALLLYSLVNTLTKLDTVNKVQMLIDGEIKDLFSNIYYTKEPLSFSFQLVNNKYVSPVSIINEYFENITNKDYKTAAGFWHINDTGDMNSSMLKSNLETVYGNIEKIEIDDYIIYNYESNINMNIIYTTYTDTNDAKTVFNQDITLIFDKGKYKIYNIMNH